MPLFSKLQFWQRASKVSRAPLSITLPALCSSGISDYVRKSISTDSPASKDWNTHDDFFKFTRGRFILDEVDQLARRNVKFDMNELVRIAAGSVKADHCIAVEKCADGMYNKCFVLTMNTGKEVIAKVPNPNAGRPWFTTASEVATMDFVRNILGTPAPEVYSWDSCAKNPVGAEYIIMEKMPGIQLRQVLGQMKLGERASLLVDLAKYQAKWDECVFDDFGALYYAKDLAASAQRGVNTTGKILHEKFVIGPVTGRLWFDHGRSSLNFDRGPWHSAYDYYKAVGLREKKAISSLPYPKQTAMVCGPGLYEPTRSKKLRAVDWYMQIYEALLPTNVEHMLSPYIWHNDLHDENIFVDPDNPTKVTGIIDWQCINILPLIDQNFEALLVDYHGPEPETYDTPKSESHQGLSEAERAEATRQYFEKGLLIASRRIAMKKTPRAYEAIQYQKTDLFHYLLCARRLFEVGEANFLYFCVDLRNRWSELVVNKGLHPPKIFDSLSEAQIADIERDAEKAIEGLRLMEDIKAIMGPLWPENYVVEHEQYEAARAALQSLKEEVLQKLGKSEADRVELARHWPFDE